MLGYPSKKWLEEKIIDIDRDIETLLSERDNINKVLALAEKEKKAAALLLELQNVKPKS